MSRKERKKENETIENNKDSHSRFLQISATVIGILVALYPVANYVFELRYKDECEKFYGIPNQYFSANINDKLLYLALMIVVVLVCFVPAFFRKSDREKNGGESVPRKIYYIVLSILIGVELGCINATNLINILNEIQDFSIFFKWANDVLNQNSTITIIVIMVVSIVTLFGICNIRLFDSIKKKGFRNAYICIFVLCAFFTCVILIWGVLCKFSVNIQHKTRYEVVSIDNKEYVKLSEYEGKDLVVEFEEKENGQYVFHTGQYRFCGNDDGIYRYVDVGNTPEISNE